MVIDGQWVTTDSEIRRHKADALLAHREAKSEQRFLREEFASKRKKFLALAKLLSEAETSDEFLSGPAVEILKLSDMEYGEVQSLKTVKALAEAIVKANKGVSEALQRVRELGLGE